MRKCSCLSAIIIILLLLSCTMPGPSQNHIDKLNALGIVTDLGNREDPNGNDLDTNYNPFGKKQGVLFKQRELYLAGVGINGKNQGLFGDGTESYTRLFQESADDWATGHPKKSVAADVDGDGLDEVVASIFYFTTDELALRIVDYNNDDTPMAREVTRLATSIDFSEALDGTAGGGSSWEDAYLRQDLAAGDFDGDGRDEIVVTVELTVLVFDDYLTSFALMASATMENLNGSSDTYVRVDTGDFDMDGRDEIILTNGEANPDVIARYYIYDDLLSDSNFTTILDQGYIQATDSETYAVQAADVAVGDYDGDGLPEAAFAGKRYQSDILVMLVLDTFMNTSSQVQFDFLDSVMTDNYEDGDKYHLTGIAAGDIDGDGDDEIACYNDLLVVNNGSIEYHSLWGNEALEMGNAYTTENFVCMDTIHVGDVNGDRKEDVVYVTNDADQVYIYTVKTDGTLELDDSWTIGTGPSRITLCLPNIDDDSAILDYTGHELLFTDPIVIAVLASPPYFSGINSGGTGGTSFGYIEGHGTEETSSHGFSTGVSVGAEFDLPFGLGGAEVKTSVSQSMNWGTASTHEVTETWGYTTSVGENKVVFTSIPFDVYYYTILSSPVSSQIGETVSINVPRTPGRYHQETGYYNSHRFGDAIAIDSTIMEHTKGKPFTYANETDKEDKRIEHGNIGLFSDHYLQVGTGSGSSTISLEDLTGETSTFEYDLDVTVEAEAKAGGITYGTSAGYGYGYSYSSSVISGTYIQGQVPDIPPARYDSSKAFRWGLMSYPQTSQGQKFTIVTYWVQGL
jgi:hypothetical protein